MKVPSTAGVAARVAGLTLAASLGGFAFLLAGTLSGVTSIIDVKRDGVFADGKTLVVEGTLREADHVYVLSWKGDEPHGTPVITSKSAAARI